MYTEPMKATIQGIVCTGSPEEIAKLIQLTRQPYYRPGLISTVPSTGITLTPTPYNPQTITGPISGLGSVAKSKTIHVAY